VILIGRSRRFWFQSSHCIKIATFK
jgi:hypothetical protein